MALTEKLTGIADAIRGKTGKSEALTLDQMATEIAGIETGGGSGGGNMESGEFVGVQGSFNIPVSSKKTHVMMFPQNVNDENGNTNRISYISFFLVYIRPHFLFICISKFGSEWGFK